VCFPWDLYVRGVYPLHAICHPVETPLQLPPDPGLIVAAVDSTDAPDRFVKAIAKHRHFVRETDPPRV
jgi:hypothetical protein